MTDCGSGSRRSSARWSAIMAAAMVVAVTVGSARAAMPDLELKETAAALDGVRADTQRLRAELVQVAQATGSGDGAPVNTANALLAVRISQLEQDLRAVTGRVEELSYQVRRLDEKLDKFMNDVDYRLNEQGKTAGAPASGSPAAAPSSGAVGSPGGPRLLGPGTPPQASAPAAAAAAAPEPAATAAPTPAAQPPAQSAATTTGSARDDYVHAFGLLQKGDYAGAQTAFSDFLQQHKDDPLADNARYWLGETFYARGDYRQAAEAFLNGYEKNKTGPKAPDTLLKLGMSLAGLDKTKEACASFHELTRAFPDAAPAIKDRAAQEQQRLKCP